MRLLRVELTRFRSRRAIAMFALGAVLLTVVMAAVIAWDTRPVSDADQARAEAQAARDAERPSFQREVRRCEEKPERYFGPGFAAEDCAAELAPRADWYLYRSALDPAALNEETAPGLAVALGALLVLAGATFAGADWASGSTSNQLLFDPRRVRVWLAKMGAVLLSSLVVAGVLMGVFWAVTLVIAQTRDIATPTPVLHDIAWTAARATLLAAAAAVGGFATSMLLRSTVATLAILFVLSAGSELLLAALPVEGARRWSPSLNVFGWIQDGVSYYDQTIVCLPGQMCDQQAFLTLTEGASYLSVVLVVVLVLSLLSFRTRDVP